MKVDEGLDEGQADVRYQYWLGTALVPISVGRTVNMHIMIGSFKLWVYNLPSTKI